MTLYVGALVATKRHAHHATQIILAPRGVTVDDASGSVRASLIVIPPRLPHAHGETDHAALLFLDGDAPVSRELAHRPIWTRDRGDLTVPRDPTPAQARALLAAILDKIDPGRMPAARHPAVRRMCALLDGVDHGDLARLARDAGLSPRQMRHAFARDVGLSMRAYIRWQRVRRAIAAVESGANLTAAAVAAGFADSAHLSRVFREQFGMMPIQGLGSVRWRTLD